MKDDGQSGFTSIFIAGKSPEHGSLFRLQRSPYLQKLDIELPVVKNEQPTGKLIHRSCVCR
jgi:hypothetical protein